jgi:hypothetical protein
METSLQLNLLRLYEDEIKARISMSLSNSPQQLKPLHNIIRPDKIIEISQSTEADEAKKSEELWNELLKSPMKSELYLYMLEFLASGQELIIFIFYCNFMDLADQDLHSLICIEGLHFNFKLNMQFCFRFKYEFILGLMKILKNYPEIIDQITSWETFSRTLIENVSGVSTIVDPLIERVKCGELSEVRAKKLVLRIVPTVTLSGYEHILYAISLCSISSYQYVQKINPNFDNDYGKSSYTILLYN